MKALVISLCSELLSEMEFVTPLVRIARHSGYLVQLGRVGEVTHARGFDAVLLSGAALQDFGYLAPQGLYRICRKRVQDAEPLGEDGIAQGPAGPGGGMRQVRARHRPLAYYGQRRRRRGSGRRRHQADPRLHSQHRRQRLHHHGDGGASGLRPPRHGLPDL